MLPELERELLLALRVAVLLADGYPREEAARRLGLTPGELAPAIARIERAAERISRDDETAPMIERSGVTS